MNWKEFFKPTKAKIILTLILTIIFVPTLKIDRGIRCIKAPCPTGITVSIIIYLLALFSGTFIYQIYYLNLIIGLLISYLVSCILVWGYKKFKKQNA